MRDARSQRNVSRHPFSIGDRGDGLRYAFLRVRHSTVPFLLAFDVGCSDVPMFDVQPGGGVSLCPILPSGLAASCLLPPASPRCQPSYSCPAHGGQWGRPHGAVGETYGGNRGPVGRPVHNSAHTCCGKMPQPQLRGGLVKLRDRPVQSRSCSLILLSWLEKRGNQRIGSCRFRAQGRCRQPGILSSPSPSANLVGMARQKCLDRLKGHARLCTDACAHGLWELGSRSRSFMSTPHSPPEGTLRGRLRQPRK